MNEKILNKLLEFYDNGYIKTNHLIEHLSKIDKNPTPIINELIEREFINRIVDEKFDYIEIKTVKLSRLYKMKKLI